MKERLLVRDIIKFIDEDVNYPIAIIAGVRRTGKTTILKQVQKRYADATYIDFSNTTGADELLEEFMSEPRGVLLLDEISFLDNYENICQDIYNSASSGADWKLKVVITGSSPAHLCKLAYTKLGGGRAKLFHLPIITFVEYLYFTGRIDAYDKYSGVTVQDFKDYLVLKGLPAGLALSFDKQYFIDYYQINTDSNNCSHVGRSITELKKDDLVNIANLLAYQLSEHATYDVVMNPDVGGSELRRFTTNEERARLRISDAIINESVKGIKAISHEDRARMIAFLLDSRIANIGTTLYSEADTEVSADDLYSELRSSTSKKDMDKLFAKISVAINSPLLYTRLGDDILKIAGSNLEQALSDKNNNDLLGKLLEVYVRGALAQRSNPLLPFSSAKLNYPVAGEVDICDFDNSVLCEVTAGQNKDLKKINVCKYYKRQPCVRICTTQEHEDMIQGFHRIPYPKLCCMIDTGDILKLNKTMIEDRSDDNPFRVTAFDD